MIEIKYRLLRNLLVLYLAIPIIIFFMSWLNPLPAILFTLGLTAAVFFIMKDRNEEYFKADSLRISKKHLILIAVIAFAWCFLAGQGGFMHQSGDHVIRNVIMKDLVRLNWPVTYRDGSDLLCYYIAHWMVPASAGKIAYLISGSIKAGYAVCNVVLLLWSTLGCFLTLTLFTLMTCFRRNVNVFVSIFIFILFSGADIIHSSWLQRDHFEWWIWFFQYSSISTCLFWVYNQAIAAWIVTLCIINENNVKNFALIGLLALPYAPLPLIGIVYICVVKGFVLLFEGRRNRKFSTFLMQIFSPQNLLGVLTIATVYILYYMSNMVIMNENPNLNTGFRFLGNFAADFTSHDLSRITQAIYLYAEFILTEFGLLAICLHKYMKKDFVYKFVVVSLLFIPLFQVGIAHDFCMRVSIPGLIYICFAAASFIQQELSDKEKIHAFSDYFRQLPVKYYFVGFVLFIFLYNPQGENYISNYKLRLIVPAILYAAAYLCYYLRKKNPGLKLPFKHFTPILKTSFAAAVFLLILGAATPAKEFDREIMGTMREGSIFQYEDNNSMEIYDEAVNFFAHDYERSAFYKYLCRKD